MDVDRLFQRLYPPLYRYLYRMTGDGDVADDAAQEAFVRLTRHTLPDDEVRPWLFTVATNLIRDRARKAERHRRLHPYVPSPSAAVAPDITAERNERVLGVRAALEQISERDRTMLMMREEGFRYQEIARVVGVAPASVGTLLARAVRSFERVYMAEHAEETI